MTILLVGTHTGAELWNAEFAESEIELVGSGPTVSAVALSPIDRDTAVTTNSLTATLWNLETCSARCVLRHPTPGALILSVRFSPTGDTLFTCGSDGTVRLWDATTPREGACLSVVFGHSAACAAASLNPRGEFLATASLDKTVRIHDVRSVISRYRLGMPGHCRSRGSWHSLLHIPRF